MQDSIQLITPWIENLENNIINDKVLLLVFKNPNYHIKLDKDIFNKQFLNHIDSKYYRLFNIKELDNMDIIQSDKKSKNIIILGHINMSIYKIANINFEILLFFSPLQNTSKFNSLRTLLEINSIQNPYKHIITIKKKDPIKIIKSNDFRIISDQIESLFNPYLFNKYFTLFYPFYALKSDRSKNVVFLKNILLEDIFLLIKNKKLTSRLAIAIYKASTLKFNENNTKIGIFFRKNLGIKSNPYKLPNRNNLQTVKVYDLKILEKI